MTRASGLGGISFPAMLIAVDEDVRDGTVRCIRAVSYGSRVGVRILFDRQKGPICCRETKGIVVKEKLALLACWPFALLCGRQMVMFGGNSRSSK